MVWKEHSQSTPSVVSHQEIMRWSDPALEMKPDDPMPQAREHSAICYDPEEGQWGRVKPKKVAGAPYLVPSTPQVLRVFTTLKTGSMTP